MKKNINYLLFILALLPLFSCNTELFVNEKISQIGFINQESISKKNWIDFKIEHSVNNIKDTVFISVLSEFKSMPFETELYYFDDSIKEIIAVDKEHYFVRYVFNPLLSKTILDGFSEELSDNERKRIMNRIESN